MTKAEEGRKRRQAFIEAALRLFLENGYQRTSLEMILKAVGVSKGAFYHHFKSKEDILDRVTDQYSSTLAEAVCKVYENKTLSALEKIRGGLSRAQEVRESYRGLLVQLYRFMEMDDNVLFKKKFQEKTIHLIKPSYTEVIKQGVAEGVFDTSYPEEAAETIIRIGSRYRSKMARLYFNRDNEPDYNAAILKLIAFLEDTIERILGMKAGTLKIVDSYLSDPDA